MSSFLKYGISLYLLIAVSTVNAQSRLAELFSSIELSSKQWMLYEKGMLASELAYKTDNFISNPRLEYESGSRLDRSREYEFSIVQDIDFPTIYHHKKRLANNHIELLSLQRTVDLQNVFLQAKLLYIERVFLNKRKKILVQRYTDAKKLYKMLSKAYNHGSIGILEYNKARLNKLSVQNARAALHRLEHDNRVALTKLNGGVEFVITDSFYSSKDSLYSLSKLLSDMEKYDPSLQVLMHQEYIASIEESIAKAQSLPSFYGGFLSKKDAAGSLNGIKMGLSIPLFENKNKIKLAKARVVEDRFEVALYMQNMFVETEALYHDLKAMESLIDAYKEVEEELDVEHLLSQSFDLGEISLVDYLNQLAAHYVFVDEKLELEQDYYKGLASLLKYKL